MLARCRARNEAIIWTVARLAEGVRRLRAIGMSFSFDRVIASYGEGGRTSLPRPAQRCINDKPEVCFEIRCAPDVARRP